MYGFVSISYIMTGQNLGYVETTEVYKRNLYKENRKN